MAAADDVTGQLADLPDSLVSGCAAEQVGCSLALLSLAAVIDTYGDAVGTTEQSECVQFDTTVAPAATDRIYPTGCWG